MQRAPFPLLDLRSCDVYAQWHVQRATNIPFRGDDSLLHRLHELPAPPAELFVLADENDEHEALALLHARGYRVQAVTEKMLRQSFNGVSGTTSEPLWSPSPLVAQALPLLSNCRTVLDIGCGAGRDACYFAKHGMQVIAVDRDAKLVNKAHRFGGREAAQGGSVTAIERTFGRHLGEDRLWLQQHKADVVCCVRFLRRGVLEMLWQAVKEGGYVLYEHFLLGCENLGGPNKRSQLLSPNELSSIFTPQRGFKIIHNQTAYLTDGRPVARFIASKS